MYHRPFSRTIYYRTVLNVLLCASKSDEVAMVTSFVINPIARQMRCDRTPIKFGKSRQSEFKNYYEIGINILPT